jgi:hypothetical protein
MEPPASPPSDNQSRSQPQRPDLGTELRMLTNGAVVAVCVVVLAQLASRDTYGPELTKAIWGFAVALPLAASRAVVQRLNQQYLVRLGTAQRWLLLICNYTSIAAFAFGMFFLTAHFSDLTAGLFVGATLVGLLAFGHMYGAVKRTGRLRGKLREHVPTRTMPPDAPSTAEEPRPPTA